MSKEAWERVYRDAWRRYYTDAHVETVLQARGRERHQPRKIVDALTVFSGAARIEDVHPLQFGFVRRKVRTQRRHGMPIVNPLIFYPWRALEVLDDRVGAGSAGAALSQDHAAACSPTGPPRHIRTRRCSRRGRRTPNSRTSCRCSPTKIPHTHGAPVREAVGGRSLRRRIAALAAAVSTGSWPILPSVPASRRLMLARCMTHTSTVSSRNKAAS